MPQAERIYEENRLKRTLEEIRRQLSEREAERDSFVRNMRSNFKNMWEEVEATPNDVWNPEQYIQAKQYLDEARNMKSAYQSSASKLLRLEKMISNPYFARIDFIEKGEDTAEEIYIGLTMVQNEESLEILVYDWRAPISGMFYDYDSGPARYESPAGTIEGNMTLKRQFRIRNGQIELMFDSAVKIDDEILQELLGQSKDEKMKTIVTSIQREQNLAIRDEGHSLLIVEGPAGSGKTSIALHRIAFLLYRYRNSITNSNMVIFSPNEMFNDYISEVLPELGEENVRQTTFMEYARSFLKTKMSMYDLNQQMDFFLTYRGRQDYADRVAAIRYKSSTEFLATLNRYIDRLYEKAHAFEEFDTEQEKIITAKEQHQLFTEEYTYLPLVPRLKKIKNRILYLIKQKEICAIKVLIDQLNQDPRWKDESPKDRRSRAVRIVLKQYLPLRQKARAIGKATLKDYYTGLYKEENFFQGMEETGLTSTAEATLKRLEQDIILYEDLAPMLYLKGKLYGIPRKEYIRFVIIDEVQDYTPLQMEIIRELFASASFTVVGDLNQSINPYANIGDIDALKGVFQGKDTAHIRLEKSYRSTREITEFCRSILNLDQEIETINRSGAKPCIYQTANMEGCIGALVQSIQEMIDNGYKSVAVITRTRSEAEEIYEHLHRNVSCHLVANADSGFPKGVSIIPSYLAKGLEFDVVYVLNLNQPYKGEEEQNLFYTVCTRALHQLFVFTLQDPPEYLKYIPENLYEMKSWP